MALGEKLKVAMQSWVESALVGKADLSPDTGRLVTTQIPDIDCGKFESTVAMHNVNSDAHASMIVDGNNDAFMDDSKTLEAHMANPYSHQNIIIDGNL